MELISDAGKTWKICGWTWSRRFPAQDNTIASLNLWDCQLKQTEGQNDTLNKGGSLYISENSLSK